MIRKSLLKFVITALAFGFVTNAVAQNGVSTFQFPLVFNSGHIGCAGESLTVSLTVTARTQTVVTPSGHVHLVDNWSIEGAATGDSSGDSWFVHGASPFVINTGGDQFTNPIVVQLVFEPLDAERKLRSTQRLQIVVDANGDLRVLQAEFPQYHCIGNG